VRSDHGCRKADFRPCERSARARRGTRAATPADGFWVSAIDPNLGDTAAFREHNGIGLDISANCVVVEPRRAERTWHAACLVLATTRADVNGIVRKHLGARKIRSLGWTTPLP
jgi:hypothetical protein